MIWDSLIYPKDTGFTFNTLTGGDTEEQRIEDRSSAEGEDGCAPSLQVQHLSSLNTNKHVPGARAAPHTYNHSTLGGQGRQIT